MALETHVTRSDGAGLVCLWNDVLAESRREYDLWHTLEHVPERVWVPGIRSGARYLCTDDSSARCFTLLEVSDLSVLEGPLYRDLVEHPTPWSVAMRPAIKNFLRKPGPLVGSAGQVSGCAISVTRLVWPQALAADELRWPGLAQDLLSAGAGFLVTRVRISAVAGSGPQAFSNADDAPAGEEYIVIVETADPGSVDQLGTLVDTQLRQMRRVAAWQQHSRYRLVCRVLHDDVKSPMRPPPRHDLMPR